MLRQTIQMLSPKKENEKRIERKEAKRKNPGPITMDLEGRSKKARTLSVISHSFVQPPIPIHNTRHTCMVKS